MTLLSELHAFRQEHRYCGEGGDVGGRRVTAYSPEEGRYVTYGRWTRMRS